MILANPMLVVMEDCDSFGGDNAVRMYTSCQLAQ